MKKLIIALLLLAGSAMAQQRFHFTGNSHNGINYDVLPPVEIGLLGTTSGSANPPNVASDYAPSSGDPLGSVLKASGTTIAGDGFVSTLSVNVFLHNGMTFSQVSCSDVDDAVRVHDGDRIGVYVLPSSSLVVVVVGTTQTILQCTFTPGATTVIDDVDAVFFKK